MQTKMLEKKVKSVKYLYVSTIKLSLSFFLSIYI